MQRHRRVAFTLVELLVVIAIIGILVALLLPAVQAAREASRRSRCTNNLKQIGLAVQMYQDTHGHYPSGRLSHVQQGESWAFRLLPFMEQKAVHDSFNDSVPVFDDINAQAMRTPIETYVCPSRRTPEADRDFDNNDAPPVVTDAAAGGDYVANAGLEYIYGTPGNAVSDLDPAVTAGPIHSFSRVKGRYVTDGTSQTLAVGEKHIPTELEPGGAESDDQKAGDTAFFAADRPTTIFAGTKDGLATGREDRSPEKFGSEHNQLVHFVFLDGHVTALDGSIDNLTLRRLSTIADGQVIDTAEL